MARFKIGDEVFVPNAFEWIWETAHTIINDVEELNGETVYICPVCRNNLASRSGIQLVDGTYKEHEIFPATKEGKAKCDEYISNYYYDGYCKGCSYDKIAGQVWKCTDCKHCKADEQTDLTKPRPMRCEFTGIIVSEYYNRSHSIEACSKFEPFRPQDIRDFCSWQQYDDYLKNCEFNKECIHHKKSAHKTCTYERYMDHELIRVPFVFSFNGRLVTNVKISRRRWIEQTFLLDGKLYCYSLEFKYELNRRGLPRKEDQPIYVSFPDRETNVNENYKEVIIDVKKGEIVGETGGKI